RGLCGRHLDAGAREPQCWFDEPCPLEPSMAAPELGEAGRHARDPAGGDPDRVMDELGAEGNVELEQRGLAPFGAEARDGDEEVKVLGASARAVVVDRVPAPEQTR